MASSISSSVFEIGNFKTVLQRVESAAEKCGVCKTRSRSVEVEVEDDGVLPPKPVLICAPCESGEFPVVILLHGYLLYNSFYTQLILHVASHGFIVIVPQLYTVAGPDASDEIKSTAAITNWLPKGLQNWLPPNVKPNLTKLALSGHSRGGKTAFGLALRKAATTLKFSALIGIDPVDGMDKGKQTPPHILTYVPRSFDLDMPVMVLGSGLGEIRKNPLFPACAPKGVNHNDFFNECQKPACYFVPKDYGHLDMLDDETQGIRGKATYCLCKNGESREPMRRFVGGILVAFMKAYLVRDTSDLMAIKDGYVTAPLELKTVEFLL